MADEVVAKELRHDAPGETIARLASQRSKWRKQAASLVAERDTARAEVTKLKGELASSGDAATELAALKASVKVAVHRTRFNELAKAAGARENALDDLWQASGITPTTEVPDDAALTKAVESQRQKRDYCFNPATEEGTPAANPDTPPEPKPGPGKGQGGTKQSTGSQFQATDAQLRDPAWCFANAGKLQTMAQDVAGMSISAATGKFAIV